MDKDIKGKIEAILFASGEPVEISRMGKFFNISKKEIKEKLEELKKDYLANSSGLTIVEKKEKVQLSSEPSFGETVMKFMKREIGESLSPAALEILAVVAYRGPLTRAQIEYIRGVNCSFMLRGLAMRGLIERKENPNDSRSYLYEISFDFMNSLGVKKLEDLPEYGTLINKNEKSKNETKDKN